jgi:hypothetical protein
VTRWDAFGWAALGGATAGLVMFVAPIVVRDAIRGKLTVSVPRVGAWLVAIIVLALVAGVTSLVPHLTSVNAAVGYGLGVNTVIRALGSAGQEAFPGLGQRT